MTYVIVLDSEHLYNYKCSIARIAVHLAVFCQKSTMAPRALFG